MRAARRSILPFERRTGRVDDAKIRERLKLSGEISLLLPEGEVLFSAVEILHEDGAWRVQWDAPLSELRKLTRVGPAVAAMLAHVAHEPETARGNLRLVASAALVAKLDAALPPETGAQDWLGNEAFALLIFTLEPWTPESVGITTGGDVSA